MSDQTDTIRADWLSAQAGCIGAVLQKPELAGELLSATGEADFDGPGRVAWLAISRLFSEGKAPDPVQVGELAGARYHEYLLQCMDVVPSPSELPRYMDLVRDRAKLSRVREICTAAAASETLSEISDHIQQAAEALAENRRQRVFGLSEMLLDFYDRKQKGEVYLPSGLSALDSRLFLSAGDYVILGGRPSRGKTALAIQMALRQSRDYRVGFYSLETEKGKVTDRLMSHYAKVPLDRLKRADLIETEWSTLGSAASALTEHYHLEVVEAAGCTVDEIFQTALARRHQIIYIDYLQLAEGAGKSPYEVVTGISKRIHQLSQVHKIMVVALSQLSRQGDKGEEPGMADLRESGQIEQDADAILMIYYQDAKKPSGPRWLKVAKNKEGETGRLGLDWNGNTQTFTPMTSREAPPAPRMRPVKLPKDTPVPEEWEPDQMSIEEAKDGEKDAAGAAGTNQAVVGRADEALPY